MQTKSSRSYIPMILAFIWIIGWLVTMGYALPRQSPGVVTFNAGNLIQVVMYFLQWPLVVGILLRINNS